MKNIILLTVITFFFSNCKTTYETTVSGLDNSSAIKVLKSDKATNDYESPLLLIIDEKEYTIEKVYSEKKSLKAPVFTITPGKHKVVITKGNKTIYKKDLFIDNRETRTIILN